MLEMHTAHQEDPILLANMIKNLCNSFGRISTVSIFTDVYLIMFNVKLIYL